MQRQVNAGAIRAIRQGLGVEQAELARRADISRFQMNRIEKGVVTPKIETLVRIARELGVSIDDIAPVITPEAAITS